jgi:hypothetical protein
MLRGSPRTRRYRRICSTRRNRSRARPPVTLSTQQYFDEANTAVENILQTFAKDTKTTVKNAKFNADEGNVVAKQQAAVRAGNVADMASVDAGRFVSQMHGLDFIEDVSDVVDEIVAQLGPAGGTAEYSLVIDAKCGESPSPPWVAAGSRARTGWEEKGNFLLNQLHLGPLLAFRLPDSDPAAPARAWFGGGDDPVAVHCRADLRTGTLSARWCRHGWQRGAVARFFARIGRPALWTVGVAFTAVLIARSAALRQGRRGCDDPHRPRHRVRQGVGNADAGRQQGTERQPPRASSAVDRTGRPAVLRPCADYWLIITAFNSDLQMTCRVTMLWPTPWTSDQFFNLLAEPPVRRVVPQHAGGRPRHDGRRHDRAVGPALGGLES